MCACVCVCVSDRSNGQTLDIANCLRTEVQQKERRRSGDRRGSEPRSRRTWDKTPSAAAVSPAPLDQDVWEQAEKVSEISWVKRRLAGYELFNWLIHLDHESVSLILSDQMFFLGQTVLKRGSQSPDTCGLHIRAFQKKSVVGKLRSKNTREWDKPNRPWSDLCAIFL